MTHDEAFLQAIRDEPDDDAPRLVYADWLEDHGQEARAEFIRVQCERARPDTEPGRAAELEMRAWRLLVENWKAWVGPLRELVGPDGSRRGETWLMGGPHAEALFKFRRGFVESLALGADVFVRLGGELARLMPLRHLLLWRAGAYAPDLAASPHLEGVSRLDFSDYFIAPLDAAGARALASSPYLGRLRALHLYDNNLGDAGLRALAEAPWLAGLRLLNVMENGLSAAGVRALVASPHFRLEELRLGSNPLGGPGAAALAGAPASRCLRALDLRDCTLGRSGLDALAESPYLGGLRQLGLDSTQAGPAWGVLLAAGFLPQLTALNLNRCDLGDPGAETLAGSRGVRGLTALGLSGNEISDRGARALAASPHLSRLKRLSLQANRITAAGEAALRRSPHLRRLTSLNLQGNPCAQGA